MKSQWTSATKLAHSLKPKLELLVLPLLQQCFNYIRVEHSLYNAVHSKVNSIRLLSAVELLSVHPIDILIKLGLKVCISNLLRLDFAIILFVAS